MITSEFSKLSDAFYNALLEFIVWRLDYLLHLSVLKLLHTLNCNFILDVLTSIKINNFRI